MSQADQIRQFILGQYVLPAREAGKKELTLRAGDIHNSMGLTNRYPAVCSALEGKKLRDLGTVSITHRHGPPNGANVFVTFSLEPNYRQAPHPIRTDNPGRKEPNSALAINPSNTLVLVSCVKSKLPRSAAAQDLYTSTLFTGCRALARASGAPWFVLSSRYGLVHPDKVIAPYEYTLNRVGVVERKAWAKSVLWELLPKTQECKNVVFLAGQRYREFLVGPLQDSGLNVLIPMEHLKIGEQLQWLSEHT